MARLLTLLLFLLNLQACQISPEISELAQAVGGFIGENRARVVLPESKWYKSLDPITVEFVHTDTIYVQGYPFIGSEVGVNLGFVNNCIPQSDCPITQSSGHSRIGFDPKNFLITGSFHVLLPGLNLGSFSFGNFDGINQIICNKCTGSLMASQLATLINKRTTFYKAYTVNGNLKVTAKRNLFYSGGSGTKSITFQYSVSPLDLDPQGIIVDNSITMNGGQIFTKDEMGKISSFRYDLKVDNTLIKVDGDPPVLQSLTPPLAGNYTTGDRLNYELQFSEDVFTIDGPRFNINFSSGAQEFAEYLFGSGSRYLKFSRLVSSSDLYAGPLSSSTSLEDGLKIVDQAGNLASSTLPSTSVMININQSRPLVSSIVPPPPATYGIGATLSFIVNFSEPIIVSGGIPSITLRLQTGDYLAKYVSGSGTNSLVFQHVVGTNQIDLNGIEIQPSILLNGAGLKGVTSSMDAVPLITTSVDTSGVMVNAANGPFVTYVMTPSNNTYVENEVLTFRLYFNSSVNVSGNPRLPLTIGNSTRYATYVSGSGSTELVFTYTPVIGEEDLDGISLTGLIDTSSTITNTFGKTAIESFSAPDLSGVKVDGTLPIVSSVSSLNSGTYLPGSKLNFVVEFSEPIVVNTLSPPVLNLSIGGQSKAATYLNGSGNRKLTFFYDVVTNDEDTNGIEVLSLTGSVTDQKGHIAINTFSPFTDAGTKIDAVAPIISSIESPVDGNYMIGSTITFAVHWSTAVMINRFPRISFISNGKTYYANFVQSLSTSTKSTFVYTVKTGDSTPAGITLSALDANGGTIKDAAGNLALLTLPPTSVLNVIMDGSAPKILSQTYPAGNLYKLGQTLNFTVTWDEEVVVTGIPYLKFVIGSTVVKANYSGLSNSNKTATFSYPVSNGDLDTSGIEVYSSIYFDNGVSIKDVSGNHVAAGLSAKDTSGIKIDGVPPRISSFLGPDNGTYIQDETLAFTIFWSEPVFITGTPSFNLVIGTTTNVASYNSSLSTTTKSVFTWDVVNESLDIDGVTISSLALNLASGTILDIAGNTPASLTLPIIDLKNVKVDGQIARVKEVVLLTGTSYKTGDQLWVKLKFTDTVSVVGTPYIKIIIGNSSVSKILNYLGTDGDGFPVFSYTIESGDTSSLDQGVTITGPILYDSGESIKKATLGQQDVFNRFAARKFQVAIDGILPSITSINITNGTRPNNPNAFIANEKMDISVILSEAMTVPNGSNPILKLKIGSSEKDASFVKYDSATKTLSFTFTVDAMTQTTALLDLDGIEITELKLNGANITDQSGNLLGTDIRGFSQKVYVYYSHFRGRFSLLREGQFETINCNTNERCLSKLIDISGHRRIDFYPRGSSQVVIKDTGFGPNSKRYMKITPAHSIMSKNRSGTDPLGLRNVIIVYKGPANASNTSSPSEHHFLSRLKSDGAYHHAIRLTSTDQSKGIVLNNNSGTSVQKFRFNNAEFSNYRPSDSSIDLWSKDSPTILTTQFEKLNNFHHSTTKGTIVGFQKFEGEIAEIIFLGETELSEELIEQLLGQLNDIYDIY